VTSLNFNRRRYWADYFDQQGIRYAFYSAALGIAIQEARREAAEAKRQESEGTEQTSEDEGDEESSDEEHEDKFVFSADDEGEDSSDPRIKILSVPELEALFLQMAPSLDSKHHLSVRLITLLTIFGVDFKESNNQVPTRLSVGLVGYPNVGKSSTINSLLGEKKVSVSSTPGKTKHFQTIHLSDNIILCDCPGLVFPQFATTKADLVCDGVLPIDQLREHTGPVALVVKRLPRELLEATYGLTIKVGGVEEGGDGKVKAEDFLQAYASESRNHFSSGASY
jgi:large subunit GTPase 1